MDQKERPTGITLLAIFAGFAAFFAIVHTLQLLNLLPIPGPFGKVAFFTFNLIGALLWGIIAAIYIWVFKMLWSIDARGWLFLIVLSIFNLVVIGMSLIGDNTWQAILPSLLVNALILIYCLLPGTKEAFLPPEPPPSTTPTMPKPIHETKTAVAPFPTLYKTIPEPEQESESDPVTATVENVDIEAETAVRAATTEKPDPTATEIVEEAAYASPGEVAKFSSHADFIEGIGPIYRQKLQEIGIDSPKSLLEAGATPQDRAALETQTGISHKLIMKWVHAADLYRVKGIGSQYADLLDTAGVNTVLELAQRNPENLYNTLIEVNKEKHHVREVPSLNMVTSWVEQAQELPRVLSY